MLALIRCSLKEDLAKCLRLGWGLHVDAGHRNYLNLSRVTLQSTDTRLLAMPQRPARRTSSSTVRGLIVGIVIASANAVGYHCSTLSTYNLVQRLRTAISSVSCRRESVGWFHEFAWAATGDSFDLLHVYVKTRGVRDFWATPLASLREGVMAQW